MARVSYARVPIAPNDDFIGGDSVVEWPCAHGARMPREEMRGSARGSMVKEGYYFGVPPLLLGGVSFLLHWYVAAAVLVFLALFVFSFFRDPERVIPTEAGAVVSPGDGRVVVVTEEENAGRPGKRVSIFLA